MLFIIAGSSALYSEDKPQWVGPMIGHTIDTEAIIWMWSKNGKEFTIRYKNVGVPSKQSEAKTLPTENGVVRFQLKELEPDNTYAYQISIDKKTNTHWKGQFRTAPNPGKPTTFVLATSSCMNVKQLRNQPAWQKMAELNPSINLLLGDNIYGDTDDSRIMRDLYLKQRRVKDFAALIRNVPTYAMWDDHDYAKNNSDKTAKGKDAALKAFRMAWANPNSSLTGSPDIYYSFQWGNVDFFVLDARYHRSPNKDKDSKKKLMLGEKQFKWLCEKLTASKAPFKIIACGTTINSNVKKDSWETFNYARKRLLSYIKEKKIGGVIYLSGDIHQSKFLKHTTQDEMGYPLHEIISSCIAVTHGKEKSTEHTGSFVTLEFDTTKEDPTVTSRIHHPKPKYRKEQTIRASQLQVVKKP